MKLRSYRVAVLLPLVFACHISTTLWAADLRDGVVLGHAVGDLPSSSGVNRVQASDVGWPQLVEETYVGPVFHDLDNDGTLDVIVVAGNSLYVFDHTGAIRDGWPQTSGRPSLPAAVGDLDGDGSPDIAVTGALGGAHLRVFSSGGTMLPGFPVGLPYLNSLTCSNPVFADLNGDKSLEVGAVSDLGISFFHADGRPVEGWPYTWINTEGWLTPQWCAPAVGDLDGDGKLEVVVGNKAYPQSGVHVVQANGSPMPGWPKYTDPVWASPALADLDYDGDLEIILKTGEWYYFGHLLYVWHHTGENMTGWPRAICEDGDSSRGSPAIADIDGDGSLDIVTDTSDGFLHVFDNTGNYLPGWPKGVAEHLMASPVVIDSDGDWAQEIFATYWTANSQYIGGWHSDGSEVRGFPQVLISGTNWKAHAQPHVADMDGDGDLELAVTSFRDQEGWVHIIPIPDSTYDPAMSATHWQKFRRDAHATGVFPGNWASGISGDQTPRPRITLSVWPNPFNPRTTISFFNREPGHVELAVYDLAGRRVAHLVGDWLESGNHKETWNGCDMTDRSVATGQYFVRLKTRDGIDVQKVILAK